MSNNTDFNYHDALIEIEMLFQSHILSFGYKEYSLETYADKGYFQEWKGREGCRDTDEMRVGQNIDGILNSEHPSDGEVLTYLQYVLNIAELCRRSFRSGDESGYSFDVRNYTELLSRIRGLLKRLGYDARYVAEKEYLYLVPHNPALDALESAEGDKVSTAVTEYRSTASAGQLAKKKEILGTLAGEVESFDDNRLAPNNPLYSRIRFLLDNVNIENDNSSGEHKIGRVAEMSDSELEGWYDRAFQLMLLRILTERSRSELAEVDRLADECGEPIQLITEEEIAELLSGPSDPENPGKEAEKDTGTNETAGEAGSENNADAGEAAGTDQQEIRRRKSGGNNHTVRNIVIALIIADVLFIVFLMCYFFLF